VKTDVLCVFVAALSAGVPPAAANPHSDPAAAMNDFLQNHRPCGLPNGCLPEAYVFYDAFRRSFPYATAEVVLLELPDGPELYGHAVVLICQQGSVMLWDHEVGLIPVPVTPNAGKPTLRDALARCYLKAVARLKARVRLGQSPCPAPRVIAKSEACLVAARLLGARQPTLVVYRTASGEAKTALSFLGGGLVWVYFPETGTAFVPIRPDRTYDQLIFAALQSSLADPEIVQTRAITPQGPLLANLRP
jgi:hypothetical protein